MRKRKLRLRKWVKDTLAIMCLALACVSVVMALEFRARQLAEKNINIFRCTRLK